MKNRYRIVGVLVIAVGAVWCMILTHPSKLLKEQSQLVESANAHLQKEVIVKAIPLLTEATTYQTENTPIIKYQLANVYKTYGYMDAYETLLTQLTADKPEEESYWLELAQYYLDHGKFKEAMRTLRTGIVANGGHALTDLYEDERYLLDVSALAYQQVRPFANGLAAVSHNDAWGFIDTYGRQVIAPQYDDVGDFLSAYTLTTEGETLTLIGTDTMRYDLADYAAEDVKGLSEGRTAIQIDGVWHIADSAFNKTEATYEAISAVSEGHYALCLDGKWGLYTTKGDTVAPMQYTAVAMDGLQRVMMNERAFVAQEGTYYMLDTKGKIYQETAYEDAKPFAEVGGLAPVKRAGKWGFINAAGEAVLPFEWEEAQPFTEGLAGVKIGDRWGFINTKGDIVIEPQFVAVHPFSNHAALVRAASGWQLIRLEEYAE